ncbi:anoctamin-8-like isoform X1 [Mizuhopecten yessoensis]|uniref:anoctamin-8-like isoform X1 n=1 Tax=Mizuhopecten yessoensis TaxID=6573 RepID=UPI000B45C9E3|nr:anoctamin-8-like isoform X1 [Mizuhopecten yessoensis]
MESTNDTCNDAAENKEKLSGSPEKIPYKLFGKKIFKTSSSLVASTQLLQNPVPTQDCDIILCFPHDTETATLMWLLDRLRARSPEVIVHVRHHSNTKEAVFHLTATYESLLRGAEDVGVCKLLKEDYGGGMKEFTFEDQDCFAGVENKEEFFTTQERQSIIHYMLNNLRAVKGEQLCKVKFLEGQPIVPLLQSKGIVSQVFPLHNQDTRLGMRKCWVQGFFKKQPLDKIRDYFGVKIAMYFAYLGHYTLALCIPAFLGALIWFFQGQDETVDDQWFVAFALFNAFWATLYLEHWKRRSSELAYEWGTLDKKDELLDDPRPLFSGSLRESPVTGRQEPYYAPWKRNLFRYFISWPIIFLCLCLVFVVMLLIFQLQEWINNLVAKGDIPGFCTFLPKVLLAVSIGILDEVYKKIAYWLNHIENYRMTETYENHLIIKLVLFQFVNSFLSLFYIAFYLQDMDRLRDQLAAILITRQVIGNIKEALLPYLLWKIKLYKVGYEMTCDASTTNKTEVSDLTESIGGKDEVRERKKVQDKNELNNAGKSEAAGRQRKPSLTQAEVESTMNKYEDTFEDFLEMFIQFGYVTLFSSAFPLAALCALMNNIVEIRSDAFKLCMNHQRPFGQQVQNIGTWQDALELMGVIAVIVNCALIGISGQVTRMVPNSSIVSTIIIIVILEHIILVLKFLIAYAIPDIPEAIATKKAKLEFLRRQALKKLESQLSTSVSASPTDKLCRQKSRSESNGHTRQIGHPEGFNRNYYQTVTVSPSSPYQKNLGEVRLSSANQGPASETSHTGHSPHIVSTSFTNIPDLKLSAASLRTGQNICTIKTPLGKPTSTFVSKVTIAPKRSASNTPEVSTVSSVEGSRQGPARDLLPSYIPPQPYRSISAGLSHRANSPDGGDTTPKGCTPPRPMSPKNCPDSKIPVRISDYGSSG